MSNMPLIYSNLTRRRKLADRIWADRGGAIGHLRDIGLLSRRAVFLHGVEAEDADIDMLAEAGCALVCNPELNAEILPPR